MRLSHFYFLLVFSVTTGCTAYVHTMHTPIIPVVTEEKQMVISTSIDLAGGNAEIQYKPNARWALVGAIQGGNDEISSATASVFGALVPKDLFRTSWSANAGAHYLLNRNNKLTFPLGFGLKSGYTNQRQVDLQYRDQDFRGMFVTPYLQVGMLLTSGYFQMYGGYELGAVRYPNPTQFYLGQDDYHFRSHQIMGQMAFTNNKRSTFRFYSVVSGSTNPSETVQGTIPGFPIFSFGLGYGLNINHNHTKASKIE
jgi:hypothetical protein